MSMTYFESHFIGSAVAFTFTGMHGGMQTVQNMHACALLFKCVECKIKGAKLCSSLSQ